MVTLYYRYLLSAVITVKLSVLQCKPDGIVLLVSQAVAQNLHNLSQIECAPYSFPVKVKTLGSTN